jgi:hypothetical protein
VKIFQHEDVATYICLRVETLLRVENRGQVNVLIESPKRVYFVNIRMSCLQHGVTRNEMIVAAVDTDERLFSEIVILCKRVWESLWIQIAAVDDTRDSVEQPQTFDDEERFVD